MEQNEEFPDEDSFEVHNVQSFNNKSQPKTGVSIVQKQSVNTKKQVDFNVDSDDNYEDDGFDHNHGKELKIGGVSNQKTGNFNQKDDDFEEEDDGAFDNAFNYDKDDFKSDLSESHTSQQQNQ